MNKSHRFVLLDGLRGIAALAVVIMHFTQHGNRTALFASSGLAVDLFFLFKRFCYCLVLLPKTCRRHEFLKLSQKTACTALPYVYYRHFAWCIIFYN